MKKAVRIHLTGTVQSIFFRHFIKQSVENLNVKGFFRMLEDGKAEIFLEGDIDNVNSASDLCKKGPKYAQIRKFEERDDKFQGFKDFRIINF